MSWHCVRRCTGGSKDNVISGLECLLLYLTASPSLCNFCHLCCDVGKAMQNITDVGVACVVPRSITAVTFYLTACKVSTELCWVTFIGLTP